jgi:hypothetical protein
VLLAGFQRFSSKHSKAQAAEKEQDMAEVGVTMNAWEYRAKWYGEDEKTAKARARRLEVVSKRQMPSE